MTLPDRDGVVDKLAAMLAARRRRVVPTPGAPPSDRSSALLLIQVEGYHGLVGADPERREVVDGEITRRLDRLVRSTDVLGRTAGDRFVLAADGVAPSAVGVLVDRLRSAFAMPVPVGEGLVSFPVKVAIELAGPLDRVADPAGHAAAMVERAEAELERQAR